MLSSIAFKSSAVIVEGSTLDEGSLLSVYTAPPITAARPMSTATAKRILLVVLIDPVVFLLKFFPSANVQGETAVKNVNVERIVAMLLVKCFFEIIIY